MNFCRFALAGVLVLGLTVIGVAGTDTAKKLIGKWEVTKSEDAPPGATLEFTEDGKLHMRAKVNDKEVKVDGTYKVKDKMVIATYTINGKTKSEPGTIKKLTEKVLVIEDEKGKLDEYKRVK
jgi:uncharacterized protein (TIGR03066 family)